jgi:hypothetical protein
VQDATTTRLRTELAGYERLALAATERLRAAEAAWAAARAAADAAAADAATAAVGDAEAEMAYYLEEADGVRARLGEAPKHGLYY